MMFEGCIRYHVVDLFIVRKKDSTDYHDSFSGSLLDCVKHVVSNGWTGEIRISYMHFETLGKLVLPSPDVYEWYTIDLDSEVI